MFLQKSFVEQVTKKHVVFELIVFVMVEQIDLMKFVNEDSMVLMFALFDVVEVIVNVVLLEEEVLLDMV